MTDNRPGTAMPQLAGVTHRWVDVRGLSMHVAEAGAGEPLVLLHGFPQNWWEWHGVIPRLAEHYRVIAVDQRGFGWSDAPADGYDPATLTEDIVLLLGELGLPRARFLAHDWGAIVAQLLATERHELVESLVISGCPDIHIRPTAALLRVFPKLWHVFALALPGIGPRVQANKRLQRHLITAFEPSGGVTEEDIALYTAAMATRERARAGSALYRGVLLPAFLEIIVGGYAHRDFTTPTLALIGAMEPSAALQSMGHRAGRGGNVTTEIIDGEGHFLADRRPELVADRALRFFADHP